MRQLSIILQNPVVIEAKLALLGSNRKCWASLSMSCESNRSFAVSTRLTTPYLRITEVDQRDDHPDMKKGFAQSIGLNRDPR